MRTRSLLRSVLALLVVVLLLTLARRARAQVWFDAGQSRLEDAYAEGDVDAEDLARLPSMRRHETARGDVFAQTWVSLVGLSREASSGTIEVAGMVVVGLALDRLVERRSRASLDAAIAQGPGLPDSRARAPDGGRSVIDMALARGSVRAALRTAGIGANDARIDAMIARSRLSAALPEMRLRVMQLLQEGDRTTSYVNEAGTLVDTSGTTTTLEARLTWRLDRLLFADDEPSLERLRLEREEARSRVGTRVLDLLFAWQRAIADESASDGGSRAEADADLRRVQAEMALDVITGGWFGAQAAARRAW
jgi:hypothetical protein